MSLLKYTNFPFFLRSTNQIGQVLKLGVASDLFFFLLKLLGKQPFALVVHVPTSNTEHFLFPTKPFCCHAIAGRSSRSITLKHRLSSMKTHRQACHEFCFFFFFDMAAYVHCLQSHILASTWGIKMGLPCLLNRNPLALINNACTCR